MTKIRVLCVDDHPVVREGIARKIDLQSDMEVVASAANGEEALELYRRYRPDVTVMDLRLPVMSGLDAIRAIRKEDGEARIVVLTMYEGDEDIYKAIHAGASAYLMKHMLVDDLVRVVRDVSGGRRPMLGEIAVRLAERTVRPTLTKREEGVLALIADGMRNKEVGAALGISENTVEVHVRNLFLKLGVNDRTAAVTVAIKRGILHIEE